MMISTPSQLESLLLLGDFLDVLRNVIITAIPLIAIVIWIISQLFVRGGAGNQQPPRPARPQPPQPPRREQGGAVADEIEQFLRRQQPGRPQPRPANRPRPEPVVAQVIEEEKQVRRLTPGQVSENVSTDDVTEHVRTLGRGVRSSSRSLREHVQDAFEHEVGHLPADARQAAARKQAQSAKRRTARQPAAGKTPIQPDTLRADEAAAASRAAATPLLGTANDLRRAIVIADILRRPDERWQS